MIRLVSGLLVGFIMISIFTQVAGAVMSDADLTNKYRGADENQTLSNIQAAINNKTLSCSDLPSSIIAFNCPNTQSQLDTAKAQAPIAVPQLNSHDNNTQFGTVVVVINFIAMMLGGLMVYLLLLHKSHVYRKGGYFLVLLSMIILFVEWNTNFIDDNGRIGASIIDLGIFCGISIALIVRGGQEQRFANVRETTNLRNVGIRDSSHDDDLTTIEDAIITHDRTCRAEKDDHFDVYDILYDEGEETRKSDGTLLYNSCGNLVKDKDGNIQNPRKQKPFQAHHKMLFTLGILKEKKN